MSDKPDDGDGRVTVAVLSTQLKQMDKKLDTLVADHDVVVRLTMQVEQNKQDISGLAKTMREKDNRGRREAFIEMLIAAIVGGSAWFK